MAQCMSKITYTLKNKLDIHEGIWKPFTDFRENGDKGGLLQEEGRFKVVETPKGDGGRF